MIRLRTFRKFVKFYRSLGMTRYEAMRRAWGMSRYA